MDEKQLGLEIWLVVAKRDTNHRYIYTEELPKVGLTIRGTYTKKPNVARDERAVKVWLKVPASIFTEAEISATIDVPEELILAPEVDIEVQEP